MCVRKGGKLFSHAGKVASFKYKESLFPYLNVLLFLKSVHVFV